MSHHVSWLRIGISVAFLVIAAVRLFIVIRRGR